jgi:hypothetical protein
MIGPARTATSASSTRGKSIIASASQGGGGGGFGGRGGGGFGRDALMALILLAHDEPLAALTFQPE